MLNANSITPLYKQLVQKLKDDIENGVYKPGDQLLPERDFAAQNGVSVITTRKALEELVQEGIIEKKQGKGTFVAKPKYGRDYTRIIGFSESCRLQGLEPGAILLHKSIAVPDAKVLAELRLPKDSSSVFISRLRTVNGEPMAIENNYFPLDYVFLLNEPLEGSLFDLLKQKVNKVVVKSQKTIEICRAGAQEAKNLNVARNSPLLLVKSLALTTDDAIVYYGVQIINSERFTLRM